MMDLRDRHLEKALQHAPDHDLQPGDAVRECVLAYAADAAKPAKGGWLPGLIENLRHWHITSAQMAGIGSVAVALLVLLMVREQRPADSEWATPAAPEQTAQADAPKRKAKVARPAAKALPAEELAREEMAAPVEAPPALEGFAESAAIPEAENKQAETPAMADAASAAAPLPESAAPLSTEGADAEAVTAVDALPESRARSKLEAPAKARAIDMAGKSDDVDLQYALMTQGGKTLAEQDIQAGNLRLLNIGTPQGGRCDESTKHVLQADTETGYPVEVVDVCVAPAALIDEVEAYNQAMRAWYKQQVSQ